jgi:hypothetical protein
MAEMTLADAGKIVAERGFVTLQEPASGAGGMVLAAADVLEKKGCDPRTTLYVEATDVASLCFKMTYLQLAARGVPATVFHGNTLSRETVEYARTPAFPPFFRQHQEALLRWREEAGAAASPSTSSPRPAQGDLFDTPAPDPPGRKPRRRREPGHDL